MTPWTCVGVLALSVLAVAADPACLLADKEKNPEPMGQGAQKALIGVWVVAKGEQMPKGSTIEFARKGQLTVKVKPPGMKAVPIKGTYKVAGKKLTLVTFDANGERSEGAVTIEVLTKKRLVFVDRGQEMEFTRK